MTHFIGFLPDIDPSTNGVITECLDALPSFKGLASAPSLITTNTSALSAACLGAAALMGLDGTSRVFAGTATKLYELTGTTWTDVSRVGDYPTGDVVWRFAIMGDTSLAVNKNDVLQSSNTGDFADVAGAPKAEFIDVSEGFAMLGGVDLGGGAGFEADRWICSAYLDVTDWTPSVTTECATGRLVDAPGPLRGMKALGANFVAYKDKSMFFGQYVSTPDIWRWTIVPGEIGCSSNEAVINIGTAHYFVGPSNFYVFDGNTVTPIGDGMKEWFFAKMNETYRHKIKGMHDRKKSCVLWFFPSGSDESLNSCVVFNYATNKWGYAEYNIECPLEYVSPGLTWDDLGTIAPTWDEFPNVAYDSPFWTATSQLPAVFNTSHTLESLTGVSAGMTIVTGVIGDDTQRTCVTRVRPRFTKSPSTGTLSNYYSETDGVSMSAQGTSTLNNGKFDLLWSARWHKFSMTFAGDCEVIGHTPTLIQDGLE